MRTHVVIPLRRLLVFLGICAMSSFVLYVLSHRVIHHIPLTSSILFPVMTGFLMIFHITIAVFMVMKYLCDKSRLYHIAIACGFAGSALLMLGTLSSYPDWFLCTSAARINYNDALIYYFFRNIMMAVLFLVAVLLFKYRKYNMHTVKNHIIIVSLMMGFTVLMLALSWFYSSHYDHINVTFIDNITRNFTLLWQHEVGWLLIAIWSLTLVTMLVITQLRNIFWFSGCFFCVFYIVTLTLLFSSSVGDGYNWYQARLFETIATLFLIFVLLGDVFTLYKDSNSKYQSSYQNSIRDPMTRLYNRSYFYDTLTQNIARVTPLQPVSVIVCDLDHFKRINDNYGHLQGDKVIQFVASVLQTSVRENDLAARIGGEEFALLLVNTPSEDAYRVAERIRLIISEHDSQSSNGSFPEKITISMGVFTATHTEHGVEASVQRADEAMYQAKENGRNQVVLWQPAR
ncbi:GGDEF domain-containing protein [Pluralibacter sp.]|uniref:sensor domain-containing diguanylate cyclase n=1 Tax=Pluralibacter sp. TaxID=1920032 RepID=UPI0025CCD70F|nr:GGDEF domain-containing protein [Pluralibacter sp.]MBV8041562.1 GGDEF domain-containing protein [Pluralibacter sp.]